MVDLAPPFRAATSADCRRIAELFAVASAGVSVLVWTTMADDYPGLGPIEIGEQRYARENTDFSYQNCIVADDDGVIIGMLVTFAILEQADDEPTGEDAEADPNDPPRPLQRAGGSGKLVHLRRRRRAGPPGSRPRHRVPRHRPPAGPQTGPRHPEPDRLFPEHRCPSPLRARGFTVVDRRPVIPHPLIQYTGEALLMTAKV